MAKYQDNQHHDVISSREDEASMQDSDRFNNAEESQHNHLKTPSSKKRKLTTPASPSPTPSIEVMDATNLSLDENDYSNNGEKKNDPSAPPDANNPPPTASSSPPLQSKPKPKPNLKPGVLYISRIPPFMRPSTLRHLLTPYGPLLRLFLTPEPPASHSDRVHAGGNKKRSFVDGWVEFASKRSARVCAELLNGRVMGGKKGGWYRDDLWNLRYLRGFRWEDLMEQVGREEKEREGRVRGEMEREGRARRVFLEGVERGKREEGIRETRRRRGEREGVVGAGVGADKGDGDGDGGKRRVKRIFRQNEVRTQPAGQRTGGQSEEVTRVLSKIF